MGKLKQIEELNKGTAEQLLQSILDSAFNGIMTLKAVRDQHQNIIDFEWQFANDIACKILGFSSSELLGQQLLKTLPHNESDGLFERYKNVVEKGEAQDFVQHYAGRKKDKWFKIAIVRMGEGVTVTFQDISDFKLALQEAESRERKYQKLFEESIDPIFHVDHDFMFLDVNHSFQELFGYTLSELKGSSLGDLVRIKKSFAPFRSTLQKTNKVEEYELVMVDQKGRKKICIVNCVHLQASEDEEKGYIGVIRDITKRIQADKELVQAEKLSMTGKIARTIAHEVRNPLTNLTLALEQLKDEIPPEVDDADLYLSIIRRNANRIGQLITDLLNSSKPKDLKLIQLSLNETVDRALALVGDRLKLQNMKLVKKLDKNLPEVALDADQINVALLNLFINAIEAMKPDEGKLTVVTRQEDEKVSLTIKDNGKGMSAEEMSRLFEPFFTGKEEGTGLGLTTVQNIIRSHKGSIDAESKLGKGTTFIITLPTISVD